MTQRNQAGQDAGAGEVSVECIEKARLPDFGFFPARRNRSLVEPKTAPKAKKWRSEDQIRIGTIWGMDCKKRSLNRSASGVPE